MKKGKGAVKPAEQQRGPPVQASVGTGTSPPLLLASSPALGVPARYLCWATEEEKGRQQYYTETYFQPQVRRHFVGEFPCSGAHSEGRSDSLTGLIQLPSARLFQTIANLGARRGAITAQMPERHDPLPVRAQGGRQSPHSASSQEANSCLYTPRTDFFQMSKLPAPAQRAVRPHDTKDSPPGRAPCCVQHRGAPVYFRKWQG